ncbi:toxin VasX [Gammaproteobacteria bacterium AS21]
MSKLPPNPGSNIAIDSICYPCQRPEIIPILPVRYALGQFDLDIKDLSYPTIDQLLNSDFEPVNAMVARLLRSGYVYIYIEDGAQKKEDKDADDAPSYQDKWHIFYYHSPNPDTEGNINEQGGLFVKLKIEEDDESEHLVYKRFKDKNDDEIAREYAFVPPTCSSIYIAYSTYEWSIYMLDSIMSISSNRAAHMQKIGTMLPADTDCSLPLQLCNKQKPTFDNVKNEDSSQFETTLASFVQELNPNVLEQKQAKDDASFVEKLALSAIPSIPYAQDKIEQVFNATRNKAEVGKVVVLHDPIGISQDLAAFHGVLSVSHADDIMENQYAYSTYQAIETQLRSALPSFDNPLGRSDLDMARSTARAFMKRVYKKQQQRKGLLVPQAPGSIKYIPLQERQDSSFSQDSDIAIVESEMSEQEVKEVADAYDLLKRNKSPYDLNAAVKALNPEFHETRTRINENSITLIKAIETAADNVSRWNKKTGQGYIGACFALMTEEKQAVSQLDKVRSVTRCLATIEQMTSGLEATEAGKKQIDDVLYPSAAPGTDLRYPVATIIKSLSSFVADAIGLADNEFKDFRSNLLSAKIDLLKASDKFTKALVSSPISSQNFAQDVREFVLKYEGGSAAGGNSKGQRKAEIKASIEAIADMHKTPIKFKKNHLSKFLKEITNKSDVFTQWNESLLVKYYGKLFKQDVDVLTVTVDGADHPAHALPSKVVQGASSIALVAVVYSMYVTGPSLKILTSRNTIQAASMRGLSKIYYTLVIAEASFLAVGKNLDLAISKLTAQGLAKLKIPTSLGLNKAGVAGKTLGAIKNILKITPIIGVIDAVTNYYQFLSYSERNDINAAAFSGVSIAGGSLLVLGALFSAPAVITAGFVLSVVGVIGKLMAEDGELETWITNGFWGWNEDWLGNPSQYLYWGNIEREKIIFKRFDNVEVEGFEGQLEIAKLANVDDKDTIGFSLVPKVSNSTIKEYMQREMLDYHRRVYTPAFERNSKDLLVILPGFKAGVSDLELVVTFGGVPSMFDRVPPLTETYGLLKSEHENLWGLTKKLGVLKLVPESRLAFTIKELTYSYYPNGKEAEDKGDKIVIKDSIEFNVFGSVKS